MSDRIQIERPKYLPGLGRPRGLSPETTRHGKTVWYYRDGHGPRIRMEGEFGSPSFCEAYKALRFGRPAPAPVAKATGRQDEKSLGWLIGQFRASSRWPKKANTAANYNSVLRRIEEKNGDEPFRDITPKTIVTLQDTIAKTAPAMARRFVSVMSVVLGWAASMGFIDANPAKGVIKVKLDTQHHEMWTEDDREKFCAYWERGSKEQLAYSLLFGTGQRRSDVVLMGPKNLTKDGKVMKLTQVKTEKEVGIPMSHRWMDVRAEIAAARVVGAETFIVGPKGRPMTSDAFGRWFGAAAKEAGLENHTAHGLRRSASAEAVHAGWTAAQLQSMFGYTLQQAEDYIAEFSREKVALTMFEEA